MYTIFQEKVIKVMIKLKMCSRDESEHISFICIEHSIAVDIIGLRSNKQRKTWLDF